MTAFMSCAERQNIELCEIPTFSDLKQVCFSQFSCNSYWPVCIGAAAFNLFLQQVIVCIRRRVKLCVSKVQQKLSFHWAMLISMSVAFNQSSAHVRSRPGSKCVVMSLFIPLLLLTGFTQRGMARQSWPGWLVLFKMVYCLPITLWIVPNTSSLLLICTAKLLEYR